MGKEFINGKMVIDTLEIGLEENPKERAQNIIMMDVFIKEITIRVRKKVKEFTHSQMEIVMMALGNLVHLTVMVNASI